MAAAVFVLGAGACAGPAGTAAGGLLAPGPERARTLLDSAEIRSVATLLRFEDRRVYDPGAFQALVEGAREEVRRRGAMAAGRIGDPAAGPFLLRLLRSDPSAPVRADAAFALGELADSSVATITGLSEALPAGMVPPLDEEVPIIVEVIAALGKVGGERGRSLVHHALARLSGTPVSGGTTAADTRETRGEEARARRVAAEALLTVWRFDGGPGNVEAAAPYLGSDDPELRWRAAYALMRGGDPAAVRHLLSHGSDVEHRVRAYTARALTATSAETAESADQARSWLTAALSDPHPHVRINAVRALGGYCDRAPVSAMAGLLRDPDATVAFAAAGAITALGAPAVPYLLEVLSDAGLPVPLRGAVLEQLGSVEPSRAAETLRQWAAADPARRYFAARALTTLSPEAVLELAEPLVGDEDLRVSVAALSALAALATSEASPGTRSEVRRLLLRSLESPHPVRRAVAARGLASAGRADDLDALMAAFRHSSSAVVGEGPGAREAAQAILSALGEIAEREGIPASVLAQRIFATPRPQDPWILRAAAALGGGWGVAPEAVVGDSEIYEAVVRRYIAGPLAGEPRPRAVIETAHGRITLELAAEEAPLTVHNFVRLVDGGYFDGGVWHRVIPNFVLQDGAPGGAASGGPGWTIRDETNRLRYERGALGMALSGPDTGGSQWFITHSPQPHLDGGYTVFGRVIEGMAAADRVLQGEPIAAIRMRP